MPKYIDTDSLVARQAANELNFKILSHLSPPLVISALLERALKVKNIFLVVGKPGSGKSSFLKYLNCINPNNYWINTDDFNHKLKPLLIAKFGKVDLIKIASSNDKAVQKIIVKPWLELLKTALRDVPAKSNVFIEVAYGLQADKELFRFVGGKIIYMGCTDENDNLKRVIKRGFPQLAKFIAKIPGKAETIKIAQRYNLKLSLINTDGSLTTLKNKDKKLNNLIQEDRGGPYNL